MHEADELLLAADRGGYASLGWPGGAMLRPGALADLVAIATDGVRLAGTPARGPGRRRSCSPARRADVRDVIVGGRFVVRDGAHVSLDVARELPAAIGAVGLVSTLARSTTSGCW